MKAKEEMTIEGEPCVSIKKYLTFPDCPWQHRKTVEIKIDNEGFPAIKVAGCWYIQVKKAELWHKRRAQRAS